MYVAHGIFPKDVLFDVYVDNCRRQSWGYAMYLKGTQYGQFLFQVQLTESKLARNS